MTISWKKLPKSHSHQPQLPEFFHGTTILRWTFPSWWFQPIWKIFYSNWIISLSRGENKKYLKPPSSFSHELSRSKKTLAMFKCWLKSMNPQPVWRKNIRMPKPKPERLKDDFQVLQGSKQKHRTSSHRCPHFLVGTPPGVCDFFPPPKNFPKVFNRKSSKRSKCSSTTTFTAKASNFGGPEISRGENFGGCPDEKQSRWVKNFPSPSLWVMFNDPWKRKGLLRFWWGSPPKGPNPANLWSALGEAHFKSLLWKRKHQIEKPKKYITERKAT